MQLGRLISTLMFRLGLFRLWRLLPRPLRQALVRRILPSSARGPRPGRALVPVIVVGPLRASSSFGRLARVLVSHFQRADVPVYVHDVSDAFAAAELDLIGEPAPLSLLSAPATIVLVGTPDQFGYLRSFLPGDFSGQHVVGFCPWELERLPESWFEPLSVLDEVYVPSRFVADAFAASQPHLQTRIVPCLEMPERLPRANRLRFGLPDDAFILLTVFSLRSGLERKNPAGAIAAFQRAFRQESRARLVIKTADAHLETAAFAKLQALAGDDPRIILMTETLSDPDLEALIASADVILSLHRAEGFGLVPAQAMLAGKPVIMTGWSSILDFSCAESAVLVPYQLVPVEDPAQRFSAGMRWAEPDLDQAADAMRLLFFSAGERQRLGERGQRVMTAFIARSEADFQNQIEKTFLNQLR
jgi:glycosyltransferase involved in cell wall biosynthesis